MADDPSRSIVPQFQRQTPAELREARIEQRGQASEIAGRAYDIGRKAEAHFEKHRTQWAGREYRSLIENQGLSPELRPDGREGRRFAAEADRNVVRRQAVRQARINLAQRNMIRGLTQEHGRGR